jgi:hypothetical protein
MNGDGSIDDLGVYFVFGHGWYLFCLCVTASLQDTAFIFSRAEAQRPGVRHFGERFAFWGTWMGGNGWLMHMRLEPGA